MSKSPSLPPAPSGASDPAVRAGFAAAVGAYGVWGVSPLFFREIASVPPLEVVAHRILWALVVLTLVITVRGGWTETFAILRDRKKTLVFVASATAITVNWITFVFAVNSGRALEASMGYYIFPLVTVMLGALVLKERFSRRQMAALSLVITGVVALIVGLGELPWVTLTLACSFALYGLLRKTAPAESLVGLFLETVLLSPLVLAFLAWWEWTGNGHFLGAPEGAWITTLLVLSGPLTAIPLFLFAFAARRMRLATLGLMQYMNPTLQFLLATLVFGEAFTSAHAVAFSLIWAGIAVYSIDPARLRRRRKACSGPLDGR